MTVSWLLDWLDLFSLLTFFWKGKYRRHGLNWFLKSVALFAWLHRSLIFTPFLERMAFALIWQQIIWWRIFVRELADHLQEMATAGDAVKQWVHDLLDRKNRRHIFKVLLIGDCKEENIGVIVFVSGALHMVLGCDWFSRDLFFSCGQVEFGPPILRGWIRGFWGVGHA